MDLAKLKTELDTDPAARGYRVAPVEADGYRSTAALADLLCSAYAVPNPAAQTQVRKPLDLDAILGELDAVAVQAIPDTAFAAFKDTARDDDRPGLRRWLRLARAKGWISVLQHDAIRNNHIDARIPDPAYTATVLAPPRIVALGEGGVTHAEINASIGRPV